LLLPEVRDEFERLFLEEVCEAELRDVENDELSEVDERDELLEFELREDIEERDELLEKEEDRDEIVLIEDETDEREELLEVDERDEAELAEERELLEEAAELCDEFPHGHTGTCVLPFAAPLHASEKFTVA